MSQPGFTPEYLPAWGLPNFRQVALLNLWCARSLLAGANEAPAIHATGEIRLVLGALNSDGRSTPEETLRINELFNSTRQFRQPSTEPAQAVLEHVLGLFEMHGFGPVETAAAKALPPELRAPVFTVAVDLVMADGQASGEERKFIDRLQGLLQVPDETMRRGCLVEVS